MIRKPVLNKKAEESEDKYEIDHFLLFVEQLARELKDADLFEKTRKNHRGEAVSVASYIDIARVYFESEDSETALNRLSNIPEDEAFMSYERRELYLEIYRSLGDKEKTAEYLRKKFESFHHTEVLIELLDVIGHDKKEEFLKETVEKILSSNDFSATDVEFLLDEQKILEAETYVVDRVDKLDGNHYTTLPSLAEKMQDIGLTLAASAIFRALMESILDRVASKAYYYAAKYLRKLDAMASLITDWRSLEDHGAFKNRILEKHKRKSSFMAKIKR